MVMGMADVVTQAAWIICPWCDEKKCVGRYKCKTIAGYLKSKLVEIDHVEKMDGDGNV
jgi:hypothetical protein